MTTATKVFTVVDTATGGLCVENFMYYTASTRETIESRVTSNLARNPGFYHDNPQKVVERYIVEVRPSAGDSDRGWALVPEGAEGLDRYGQVFSCRRNGATLYKSCNSLSDYQIVPVWILTDTNLSSNTTTSSQGYRKIAETLLSERRYYMIDPDEYDEVSGGRSPTEYFWPCDREMIYIYDGDGEPFGKVLWNKAKPLLSVLNHLEELPIR
jgi:hypothetical protein